MEDLKRLAQEAGRRLGEVVKAIDVAIDKIADPAPAGAPKDRVYCGQCKYWEKIYSINSSLPGECHIARPPWKSSRAIDWCGEGVRKT